MESIALQIVPIVIALLSFLVNVLQYRKNIDLKTKISSRQTIGDHSKAIQQTLGDDSKAIQQTLGDNSKASQQVHYGTGNNIKSKGNVNL